MMPDSTTPSLATLLDAERACCARLLPLLDAERAAAAAYDHAALLACLREREILQAEWQRAAAERRRHQDAAGRLLEAPRGERPGARDGASRRHARGGGRAPRTADQ
jgi:hypothetical protein